MGLIECPNCGKKTFDDEKCKWCNYTLKEKENNFDKETYTYLKNEYITKKSKPEAIKLGMQKFNLSLLETKNIVDFIADEIYDKENYKSYDEVNNDEKYRTEIYRFSFIEYLLHSWAIRAILIAIIFFVIMYKKITDLEITVLIVSFILVMFFIKGIVKSLYSEVIVEPGNIRYSLTSFSNIIPASTNRNTIDESRLIIEDYTYYIKVINSIKETNDSIIIKGSITYTQREQNNQIGKEKQLSYVKIPKHFKNSKKLVNNLKDYVKDNS